MSASIFFKPAESVFGRFSLPGKIAVLGGAFLLVVLVLYGFFLDRHITSVDFSRSERLGVAVIQPLVAVSEALREHRTRRGGQAPYGVVDRSAVAQARGRVDDALGGMAAGAEALARLGLVSEWQAIGQAWASLAATGNSSAQRDYAAHTELLARVEALIVEAADRSKLTLDPDIDSYYLMDAAALRLPGLVEAASEGGHLAAGLAGGGEAALAGRIELAGTLAVFRDDLAAVRDGMDKVGKANPPLGEEMSAAVADFLRDGDVLARDLFDRATSSQRVETGIEHARRSAQAAASSGVRLWSSALHRLDLALARRIEGMQTALWEVTAFVLAILAVAVYLFLALRSSVGRNASTLAEAAARMAAGDLSQRVECAGKDEFARVAGALNEMRQALQQRIAHDREVAVENLRIRSALDRASVNLMLADVDGCVIYMNDSVKRMLGAAEGELRKRLPSFSVDSLIGRNFDDFHRDPSHQRAILATLEGTHAAQIEVGPYAFLLKASPVIDAAGERLGTVLEWNDRTGERAAEQELAGLVDAAVGGDFERRISLEGKQGFFRQLAEGMNRLTGIVASAIDEVGSVMNAMARGDLTRKVDSEFSGGLGQLKDDVNASVDQLRALVGRIQDTSEAIKTASGEISAGNIDLSARTEQQASSLQQTASSMEELNVTVQQNAENARQAFELAGASNSVAERGGQMMDEVVANMGSIQEASCKIAEIIGVIDSIAFQTNILALNAAVEAARAGQQGRGFAVVASEVRSLAQRSAEAASQIKDLIDDSVGRVERGAGLVDQTGRTMAEIVGNIQGLTGLVTDIAEASKEQSSGIGQVTQAVGQMDQVTQQNAALVEQAAAASETLQDQAAMLVEAVGAFRLDAGALRPASTEAVAATSVAVGMSKPSTGEPAAFATSGRVAIQAAALQEEWEES